MKIKIKTRNRLYGYDINRHRPRHEQKYTKYKKCLSMMVHLRNIRGLDHEKGRQQ